LGTLGNLLLANSFTLPCTFCSDSSLGAAGASGTAQARGLAGERADGVGGAGERGRAAVEDGEGEGRRRGLRGDGGLVAGERAGVD